MRRAFLIAGMAIGLTLATAQTAAACWDADECAHEESVLGKPTWMSWQEKAHADSQRWIRDLEDRPSPWSEQRRRDQDDVSQNRDDHKGRKKH